MAVYFIQADQGGLIKIGYTGKDIASRLAAIQGNCPIPLRLLTELPGQLGDERAMHYIFRRLWVRHEWFRPMPPLLRCISRIREGAFVWSDHPKMPKGWMLSSMKSRIAFEYPNGAA